MKEEGLDELADATRQYLEYESWKRGDRYRGPKTRMWPSTLTVHLMAECVICKNHAEECFWGLYYKAPEHDRPVPESARPDGIYPRTAKVLK